MDDEELGVLHPGPEEPPHQPRPVNVAEGALEDVSQSFISDIPPGCYL